MKKIFWILVIIVAIVGGLAWFDKDFKAMLMETAGVTPAKTMVYKWQDNKGKWHVSNNPPAKGIPYTEQEYLDNANIVPALPTEE